MKRRLLKVKKVGAKAGPKPTPAPRSTSRPRDNVTPLDREHYRANPPRERRCDCCHRPAKHWYLLIEPGMRYFLNNEEFDLPQPRAVCTRACAKEMARDYGREVKITPV